MRLVLEIFAEARYKYLDKKKKEEAAFLETEQQRKALTIITITDSVLESELASASGTTAYPVFKGELNLPKGTKLEICAFPAFWGIILNHTNLQSCHAAIIKLSCQFLK